MTKIIADSTCDLSQEILDKYSIGIAPLSMLIEGKTYVDKIDITSDEFFERLPNLIELPTTSMPSPNLYLKIIDEAIAEGHKEILCICMSSGTSGSYQSAVLAKELFYESNEQSDLKIHIVDSMCMSHGSGWLIIKSARLLEQGYSFEQLIDFNETYKIKVKHLLCVADLNNLIKSGRLSNASAMIGKLINIQPIMTMKNTKGSIVAKIRGRSNALKYYLSEFEKRVDESLTDFIIIGYTSDKSLADNLYNKIKEVFNKEIMVMQMGPVVGTHVGLGGLSMFFMEK